MKNIWITSKMSSMYLPFILIVMIQLVRDCLRQADLFQPRLPVTMLEYGSRIITMKYYITIFGHQVTHKKRFVWDIREYEPFVSIGMFKGNYVQVLISPMFDRYARFVL